MNVGSYTYLPFTSFANQDSSVKINGFHFVVMNKLTFGHSNTRYVVNKDTWLEHIYSGYSKEYYQSVSDWDLGIFDKTSTDVGYLEEVARLKRSFNISDTSTLICRKIRTYEKVPLDYIFYDCYVFNFDDIFLVPSFDGSIAILSKLSSSPGAVNLLKEYPLLGLEFEHTLTSFGKSMRTSKDSYSLFTTVGIPVIKYEYSTDGASFCNALFKKDGIYYYFRIKGFPRFIEGSNCLVAYDIYKIEVNNKCCLAECFGITE